VEKKHPEIAGMAWVELEGSQQTAEGGSGEVGRLRQISFITYQELD